MSANVPTTTIQPIPESPPDTPASVRAWRVRVSGAINFLLKGVTGTPVTSVGDAAYSILPSDRVVETSVAFTAPRIWALPAANSIAAGIEISIIDAIATITATNTLTIALSGSDTIDGTAASLVFNIAGSAVTLVSDGLANWAIKSRLGGQFISSTVLIGSAVGLTSGVNADVTSVSLAAGDWDVWGNVAFTAGGTTTWTGATAWINTTSATQPTRPGSGAYTNLPVAFGTGTNPVVPTGAIRLALSATTAVYLSTQVGFGVSTCAAYGFIGARRR